jgi:hypothetical protein
LFSRPVHPDVIPDLAREPMIAGATVPPPLPVELKVVGSTS